MIWIKGLCPADRTFGGTYDKNKKSADFSRNRTAAVYRSGIVYHSAENGRRGNMDRIGGGICSRRRHPGRALSDIERRGACKSREDGERWRNL